MKNIMWVVAAVCCCLSGFAGAAAAQETLQTKNSTIRWSRPDSPGEALFRDRKFEIKAGMSRRFFWADDIGPGVKLNNAFGPDYQVALSMFTGKGEVEFAFSGGKSNANFGYSQELMDRNNLVLWLGDLYLGDIPVKLNYTEQIKLWNFQLHYWHMLEAEKNSSFSFGPGLHLNVLEKTSKLHVQYDNSMAGLTLLSPHFQDSQSQSTTLVPGFSVGARWRLGIGSKGRLGNLVVSTEAVVAKPASELKIANQPVKDMNSFNVSIGYGYSFE